MVVSVNGLFVDVVGERTLMRLCELYGLVVPRFCFHDFLLIAGNCRMCLVEVKKSLKAIAACAMPFLENMKVFTESLKVRFMRESVTEFLLVNHPLDCPICDQGGECDLQDQVLIFGNDRGRFYDFRRGVRDKNFGVLVKTVMTRCIHCTRCVRFMQEFGGSSDLGVIGRGAGMEISIFTDNFLFSPLSGNVIDLCPVGALTAKPSAFKSRSWEQVSVEVLDVFDCYGSNVVYHVRGLNVIRVLPRTNYGEYWDWITDRVRFAYDGLFVQRLLSPTFIDQKDKRTNNLFDLSWNDLFILFSDLLTQMGSVHGLVGNVASLELVNMVREFVFFNSGTLQTQNEERELEINMDLRIFYLFNFLLKEIDLKKMYISLQANLKYALPIVHSRFVWNSMLGSSWFFNFGGMAYYNSFVDKCSLVMGDGFEFFDGRSKVSILAAQFENNKNVLLFLGDIYISYFNILAFLKIFNICFKFLGDYPNLVRFRLGDLSSLELGVHFNWYDNYRTVVNWDIFSQFKNLTLYGDLKKRFVYYLINPEENSEEDVLFRYYFPDCFKIFQGSTGNSDYIFSCDFIIPQLSFIESRGTYLDIWGYEQYSRVVFKGGVDALNGESIISLVLNFLKDRKVLVNLSKVFIGCLLFFVKKFQTFGLTLKLFIFDSVSLKFVLPNVSLFFNNPGLSLSNFNAKLGKVIVDISKMVVGFLYYYFIFIYGVALNNFFNISILGKNSENCSNLNWLPQLFLNGGNSGVNYFK